MAQDKCELSIFYEGHDTQYNLNGEKVNFLFFEEAVVNREYEVKLELITAANFDWKEKVVAVGVEMNSNEYQLYFDCTDFIFDGYDTEVENKPLHINNKLTMKNLLAFSLGIDEKSFDREVVESIVEKERSLREEEELTKALICNIFEKQPNKKECLKRLVDEVEQKIKRTAPCYVFTQNKLIEIIEKIQKEIFPENVKEEIITEEGVIKEYFMELVKAVFREVQSTRHIWSWKNCKSYDFSDYEEKVFLRREITLEKLNDEINKKKMEINQKIDEQKKGKSHESENSKRDIDLIGCEIQKLEIMIIEIEIDSKELKIKTMDNENENERIELELLKEKFIFAKNQLESKQQTIGIFKYNCSYNMQLVSEQILKSITKSKEFKLRFKVFKPSSEVKMKIYFNYFEENRLKEVEFKQTILNIICHSSCLIEPNFLGENDKTTGYVPLKIKNSEKYKEVVFDTKESNVYQKEIVSPFFLELTHQKYFPKYFGRSDKENHSSFLFTLELTLFTYLNTKERKLPLIDVITFTLDICKAIQILHKKQFVHNHLNEYSILVDKIGEHINFKLANLKKICRNGSSVSLFGDEPEITCFSSPETQSKGPITFSSDVFSIGVLMIYLLHFDGNQAHSDVSDIVSQLSKQDSQLKVQFIKNLKFRCPQELCECIANCLIEKDQRLPLEELDNPKSLIPTLERMKLKYLL